MSTSFLTRAAAAAAILSGAIYIVIQFIHPAETVASVTTWHWIAVAYLTMVMAIFGLVGVTGIYLSQVKATGILGLIGFVLLAVFYLAVTANTFVEALVLPLLADSDPHFVENFLGLFNGAGTDGSLGALEFLPAVGVLYAAGGVLFGVAIFRARILARWAGLLLAVGVLAPVALSQLPHEIVRFAAIPVGVAFIWLGLSLWSVQAKAARTTRDAAAAPASASAAPETHAGNLS